MDKLLETYILPKLNYEDIKKKKNLWGVNQHPKPLNKETPSARWFH